MAKELQRQQARIFYIDQCLTAKEIAERLSVSEKTIGKWVDAGNWKEIRLSKQSGTEVLLSKQKELLSVLLDKRLRFEKKDIKSDTEKAEYNSVIDEMSKVSAMIERTQKEGRVSLRTHIHCLEKFMSSLQSNNQKLFADLIDFQINYLDLLANELK